MKKSVLVIIFSIILVSCGASKSTKKYSYKKPATSKSTSLKKLNSNYSGSVSGTRSSVLDNAENYLGTPYKYAGNTKAGFDCSGLVCKVFDENKIQMPRRSSDQAKQGKLINVSEARPGDLLFFATADEALRISLKLFHFHRAIRYRHHLPDSQGKFRKYPLLLVFSQPKLLSALPEHR